MLRICIRYLFLLQLVILYGRLIPTVLGCTPCKFSISTETEVDTCPETQDELNRRIEKKRCDILAEVQTCSTPERFKYHCAMNEHENKFIEVCAEEHRINDGYCTEYNELGRTIQPHQEMKSKTLKPKCPPTYMSSDAYLCKDCYDIVRLRKNGSSATEPQDISNKMNNSNASLNNTNETVTSNCNDSGRDLKVDVILSVIALIEFIIIIILIVDRRQRKKKENDERKKDKYDITINGNDESRIPIADSTTSFQG